MLTAAQQTDLIQLNNKNPPCPPMSSSFLSQFTSWAKVWMSSPKKSTPRKRKIIAVDNHPNARDDNNDIRSRTHQQHNSSLHISNSQRFSLYRATCQKLRPNHNQPTNLSSLGDIIHVRKFWDHLERLVYQDVGNISHYVAPSKRLPFNPDKPSWLYKKKASSKRRIMLSNNPLPKRKSFASSTIVYIPSPPQQKNSKNVNIQVVPILHRQIPNYYNTQQDDDDDDDVPLGALLQLNSKSSSLTTTTNFFKKR